MKSLTNKQLFCGCLELLQTSSRPSPNLERTLCGDLYHLSTGSSTLLELRRTAKDNGRVEHLLLFYLWDSDTEKAALTLSTLCQGAKALLLSAGYQVQQRPMTELTPPACEHQSVWALTRTQIQTSAPTSPSVYRYLEIAQRCDAANLYTLLRIAPGVHVSLFLTPLDLDMAHKKELYQRMADYTRLRDGVALGPGAQLCDPVAAAAVQHLSWHTDRLNGPQFAGRYLIWGQADRAALAVSRLKQSILDPSDHPLSAWHLTPLSALPDPHPLTVSPQSFDGWFTLEEAAALLTLPSDGTCGLDVNPFSLLPLENTMSEVLSTNQRDSWLLGHTPNERRPVRYPLSLLRYHGLIVGRSGFAKTTAIQNLLTALLRNKRTAPTPMVIAPIKSEFRNLAALDRDTLIFTSQWRTSPFLLNIFLPPPGVPAGVYKRTLAEIFAAAFSMPDPLPALFERAVAESYLLFGWQEDTVAGAKEAQVFSLHEFIQVFSRIVRKSSYSAEVQGNISTGGLNRLRSLLDRCSQFDTLHSISMDDLLSHPCVLELDGLDPSSKALTVTLLLLSMLAYIKAQRPNGSPLRNIIILDEAHALLNVSDSGNGEGPAMIRSLMEQLLLEARGSGIALCLADQNPLQLGSGIVSNCDWKLMFRLQGGQARFMAEELGMDEDYCAALSSLQIGQALFSSHVQSGLIALQTPKRPSEMDEGKDMTLLQLHRHMAGFRARRSHLYKPWHECALCPGKICHEDCRSKAAVLASRMLWNCPTPLRAPADLFKYLRLLIPSLHRLGHTNPVLCYCTAAQFLRKAALENHIYCCGSQALNLLEQLPDRMRKKEADHDGMD